MGSAGSTLSGSGCYLGLMHIFSPFARVLDSITRSNWNTMYFLHKFVISSTTRPWRSLLKWSWHRILPKWTQLHLLDPTWQSLWHIFSWRQHDLCVYLENRRAIRNLVLTCVLQFCMAKILCCTIYSLVFIIVNGFHIIHIIAWVPFLLF